MARRKCKICGNWIEDNSDSVPYKSGYAHTKCFNLAIKIVTTEKSKKLQNKTTKPKPQKELKEGLTEEEYQDKKRLCDYIRKQTDADVTIKAYKLMEDYIKKYKITHKQMLQDLKYYFEITGHPVDGDLIGIIPYIHDEAQKYYTDIDTMQNNCKEKIKELNDFYPEVSVQILKTESKTQPQIDISSLG